MRIALDIPPGLVSDDTSFSSTGRYEDAANMRFWRGRPQTIGGWDAVTSDTLAGKCRGLISWADNAGNVTLGFGTHSGLYVYQGGSLANITPTGLAAGNEDGVGGPGYGADSYGTGAYGTPRSNYYPRTWALDTYGQTLIANPRLGNIYQWTNNTTAVAARVANSPASVTYALVVFTRQIMALGCNEEASGAFNPMCIRFSDIETPTAWTTSSSNNAGEVILEGGGRIVAGRRFGSGVAVWTDNSVYFGQYTGDTNNPWRFDRIEENSGLIGPNAVAIVGQTAYWIAPDLQFRVWPLGGTPEIITCPIRSDFADNLAEAQGDKIYAASVSSFGEVWFHYPDLRDPGSGPGQSGTENSRSLFVSTVDGSWSRGNFGRTAAIDAGVIGYPIMVSPTGQIFYHELGGTANGAALGWHIKTADQYIADGGEQFMTRTVYPDFEDQVGSISLTVETRKYTPGRIGGPMKADVGGYEPTKAGFRGYDPTAEARTAIGDYQTGKASQVGGFGGYDPALIDRTVIDPIERVNARTGASFMDAYKDPYMRDVVDTTLAEFDENAGQLRARQAAQAAGNKAFGGSRYAIQEAKTESELARGRVQTCADWATLSRACSERSRGSIGMAAATTSRSNPNRWTFASCSCGGASDERVPDP